MDARLEAALERFVVEAQGPIDLGAPALEVPAPRERGAKALEHLVAQRPALVEGPAWITVVPIVAVVALAAGGVIAAVVNGTAGAVSVALSAAVAVMFRLLQAAERARERRMIFSLIQLAAKDGHSPLELVRLLLQASQRSARKTQVEGS